MKRLKRILKRFLALLLLLLAIPVLGVLGIWGTYKHVVSAKPGSLKSSVEPGGLGAEVDPFIGTGGVPWMCAHDSPAATVPFGIMRVAPDTASLFVNQQGLNRSGYFYGDNKIIGFSHTRLVGADAVEGGVFRVFPATALSAITPPLPELPRPQFFRGNPEQAKARAGKSASNR